jgi:two-component system, sensor histidine kinase
MPRTPEISMLDKTPSAHAAPHDASTEILVQAAQVRLVSDGSPKNLGSGVLAAAIIAAGVVLQGQGNAVSALVWFSLLTAGLLRGILMSLRASKANLDAAGLIQFGKRLTLNGAYCAVVWGSASWLLLPAASPQVEAFVLAATAMVLMGGAGAQAAYRKLVLVFATGLSFTFVAGLLRFADQEHVLLAIGFMVFAFVTVMFARNQEDALRKQVIFGLEREAARAEAESERIRADSASRAKTAFLAAASHDLRQPMHALVQYFAHLKRENRDERMDATIKRIDWSERDAGSARLHPRPVEDHDRRCPTDHRRCQRNMHLGTP